MHKLAEKAVELLNRKDPEILHRLLMTPEEYQQKVYPHSDAAKTLNALEADEFWRIHMGLQRIAGVRYQVEKYKNYQVKLLSVGEPGNTIIEGPYTLYRKVPVTLQLTGARADRQEVTETKLLGVVVEHEQKFKLLNVFN